MKPAAFDMRRPTSLEDALSLLAGEPDSRVIAGGQSLVPMMNLRIVAPALLVDLNGIESLAGITVHGDKLRIGAMTRQHLLLGHELVSRHAPLLGRAMPHVGHVQTRNRGTVGGSLAHADPSAELPLVMVTLDAVMHARSHDSSRAIAAREFFQDVLTTCLEPGEILTHVEIPLAPPGTRACFIEFARRHGDFAIASCAMQFLPGTSKLQAGLGGISSTPYRCAALETALASCGFARDKIGEAIEHELSSARPMKDLQADATLRLQLARTALTRCLTEILP